MNSSSPERNDARGMVARFIALWGAPADPAVAEILQAAEECRHQVQRRGEAETAPAAAVVEAAAPPAEPVRPVPHAAVPPPPPPPSPAKEQVPLSSPRDAEKVRPAQPPPPPAEIKPVTAQKPPLEEGAGRLPAVREAAGQEPPLEGVEEGAGRLPAVREAAGQEPPLEGVEEGAGRMPTVQEAAGRDATGQRAPAGVSRREVPSVPFWSGPAARWVIALAPVLVLAVALGIWSGGESDVEGQTLSLRFEKPLRQAAEVTLLREEDEAMTSLDLGPGETEASVVLPGGQYEIYVDRRYSGVQVTLPRQRRVVLPPPAPRGGNPSSTR